MEIKSASDKLSRVSARIGSFAHFISNTFNSLSVDGNSASIIPYLLVKQLEY